MIAAFPLGASQFLKPGTAALRSAGVLACELWHRPGAFLGFQMLPPHLTDWLPKI
jgi:hypothetical protein